MAIKYDKLLRLLEENGYTSYKIKKDKLLGQGTFTALKAGRGGVDAKSLDKLCALFDCQPGDLMSYIPDEGGESNAKA